VAGLLSFLSPCTIPLLPVYFAYLSKEASGRPTRTKGFVDFGLVARTLVFVLGLSSAFFLLGFGAGALGALLAGPGFRIAMGIVVILMGLYQTGLVPIPFLSREVKAESARATAGGFVGAFVLGFTFSFGWTPCAGPVLATVVGLASQQGGALYGAFLLVVYALGLALPFILISLASTLLLRAFKKLTPHLGWLRIVGGVLIVAMGVLLLLDKMTWLVGLFT
jgi:cytochrome c biogenesis protein CcdA